jgi:hypothetical protein
MDTRLEKDDIPHQFMNISPFEKEPAYVHSLAGALSGL